MPDFKESLVSPFDFIFSNAGMTVLPGVFLLSFLIWFYNQPRFPEVGKRGQLDFRTAVKEGVRKYPRSPFVLPFQDPTVIIPPSNIETLKNLPDDQISTNGNIYQRFLGKFTGTGWVGPELQGSIKFDLARDLNNIYPMIEEETDLAFKKQIGECKDWTPLNPQMKMVSIVAQITGRTFVGLPLGRDSQWLKASLEHSIAAVMFAHRLRSFSKLVRPLVAPFLAEGRTMARSKAEITALITPLVKKKMAAFSMGTNDTENSGIEEGRLISWLLPRYAATKKLPAMTPSLLVRDHFTLCFAGIHGANYAVVQTLYDLAAHQEYIGPLREEIEKEAKTTVTGRLDARSVGKLQLLDSFCKESSRMNPQGLIAWLRKTHKPITIDSGHVIPGGSLLATASPLLNNVFENTFDGYRFVKLREAGVDACNFSSTSIDSLTFGYGSHACPGRVFGTSEVKLILAYVLLNFDVRLPGGVTKRPEGVFHDFMIMLPQMDIEFRARS